MYVKTLRRASSSSFLKWPSLFGSKTNDQNQKNVAEQGTPGRSEYYVPRKICSYDQKSTCTTNSGRREPTEHEGQALLSRPYSTSGQSHSWDFSWGFGRVEGNDLGT